MMTPRWHGASGVFCWGAGALMALVLFEALVPIRPVGLIDVIGAIIKSVARAARSANFS